MKKVYQLLFALLALNFVILTGCKEDSDDPTPENPIESYAVLTDYLVANNMDITDVVSDWIVGAPAEADVATFIGAYQIMDIRDADDYGLGHIEGAVNSSLGTIVADAAAVTEPILVVCYTGQTAAHAVVALRFSGHVDAKTLKWGMSGWRADLDKWTDNTGDAGIDHANWEAAPGDIAASADYDDPTWTSTATDGAAILAERVAAMTTGGFQGVNNGDVLASPSNYQINNFWALTDVETYGHIVGANRIQPLSIAGGEVGNLDPASTVVTYCWTGQTSSMVTAYLTVLGFDAKSLKFGVNSMIYSDLTGHKFAAPTTDLPVVTE